MKDLKNILEQADISGLENLLKTQPEMANTDIIWGPNGQNHTHPLHYLCDCVFADTIKEDQAVSLAKVLFQHGALVDGKVLIKGKDSPLVGACSLYTDQLALLYLSKSPKLDHMGGHLGTCLHWACWTGSSKLVKALLQKNINLEDRGNEFNKTPLEWAVHACTNGPEKNLRDQITCIQLLISAGANTSQVKIDPVKHPGLAQVFGAQF